MHLSSDPGTGTERDHLVVIGASAGGVETLLRVVSGLPSDLPATVCIVLHISPGAPSSLPAILQRRCRLPCRAAADGDRLRAGEVLVAPPDRHLTVEDGHVSLTVGPRENGHRPSIDALFRSAALAQDGSVVGVVLSGTRDDGTAGLAVIKSNGGQAIVQDPSEALYPGMPSSAIATVDVDVIVPSDAVAAAIVRAVAGPPAELVLEMKPPAGGNPGDEGNPGRGDPDAGSEVAADPDDPQAASLLDVEPDASGNGGSMASSCPECGGVLTERTEAGVIQWQCRVGHRYSPESLADAQAEGVEAALWAAIRALEDRQALLERMGRQAETSGLPKSAQSFVRRAQEAAAQAATVREAVADATRSSLQMLSDSEQVDSERRGLC